MSPSPHRAEIRPVADGIARPLWSVMIPAYNCNAYLRTTLESVLAQDPGRESMQIEVVDDHSAEDPSAIVGSLGAGRVGYFRQQRNVGITNNFATCLNRSRGFLVHLLHGDDCVRPGFYAQMSELFESAPEAGAAFCRHTFIDEGGREISVAEPEQPRPGLLDNALERLATEQRIMTPGMVVRRSVYEQLGGFDDRLPCSEDWEMWVRIAASHPIGYLPSPLAAYRMHANSNTGRNTHNAANMRYTRAAIDIFRAYLPRARADSIVGRARETYALSAVEFARERMRQRDLTGAIAQAREALRFRLSPRVLATLVRAFTGT
jgi:glycosyltransferase involved in cell wall biosynthesis